MVTAPLLLGALPNLNAVAAVSQQEVSSQLVSDFAPNLGEKLGNFIPSTSLLAKIQKVNFKQCQTFTECGNFYESCSST